jgi:hypothetical protein
MQELDYSVDVLLLPSKVYLLVEREAQIYALAPLWMKSHYEETYSGSMVERKTRKTYATPIFSAC